VVVRGGQPHSPVVGCADLRTISAMVIYNWWHLGDFNE
jgi:hypothetical protein